MKRLTLKGVLIPTLCLFVICFVVTALLAGTNLLTRAAIEEQSRQKEAASRKEVLPTAESFEDIEADGSCCKGLDASGEPVGYVFITEGKGYGGTIKVMTGISADAQITGVVILSQEETPGLGANSTKESFRGQYRGALPGDDFVVIKNGGASADNEIDALTGATISSRAVTAAVNEAAQSFRALEAGESKGGAS